MVHWGHSRSGERGRSLQGAREGAPATTWGSRGQEQQLGSAAGRARAPRGSGDAAGQRGGRGGGLGTRARARYKVRSGHVRGLDLQGRRLATSCRPPGCPASGNALPQWALPWLSPPRPLASPGKWFHAGASGFTQGEGTARRRRQPIASAYGGKRQTRFTEQLLQGLFRHTGLNYCARPLPGRHREDAGTRLWAS